MRTDIVNDYLKLYLGDLDRFLLIKNEKKLSVVWDLKECYVRCKIKNSCDYGSRVMQESDIGS